MMDILESDLTKLCIECKVKIPFWSSRCNNCSITKYELKYNSNNKKLRKELGNKCQLCKSKINIHIHHVMPRFKTGKDTLDNLILLCQRCHMKVHHEGLLKYM